MVLPSFFGLKFISWLSRIAIAVPDTVQKGTFLARTPVLGVILRRHVAEVHCVGGAILLMTQAPNASFPENLPN